MSDPADLRRRLSRLGRRATLPPPPPGKGPSASGPLPGEEVLTPSGAAFRLQRSYPADHQHGLGRLADVLAFDTLLAADVARQPALADTRIERLLFLDTETTGLAGGAGTLAFLVGVGSFTPEGFRLRQYFLRDPAEEASMLLALEEDLEAAMGLVTFNGQVFDLPLLEARYIVGLRRRRNLVGSPHLDLLHPSRRLWSRALPDCTLGTIERQVLGLQRSEADLPGALIPELYREYLRSRDPGGMQRVIYHNAMDVLSLVGVAAQVLGRHRQEDPQRLSASEALAVGRWHQQAGRVHPAEGALRSAVEASQGVLHLEALRRLAEYLKREGRAVQALAAWAEWHDRAPGDPRPCIELAKYYEWEARDADLAVYWTQEALATLAHWPDDWRRQEEEARLVLRRARLEGKRGIPPAGGDPPAS